MVCAAVLLLSATVLHAEPPTAEEQAVLAPAQALLDGIAKRDKDLRRAQLLPGGMATLIRNGQTLQLPFNEFLDRLEKMSGGTQRLEERLYEPVIRIDNDIAVIWASYDFLIDGKVDHCGSDIFNMIRRDGRWLISGVADTSRKSCQPRGSGLGELEGLQDEDGGDWIQRFVGELNVQTVSRPSQLERRVRGIGEKVGTGNVAG